MTDTTNSKGHRLEEVLGYKGNLLSPVERSEFELHLRECPACQADLMAAGGFLTALHEEVASRRTPGRSTDEILALMAKKDAELRQAPARKSFWLPAMAFVMAVGAVILVAFLLYAQSPTPAPRNILMAPGPDEVTDGGRR